MLLTIVGLVGAVLYMYAGHRTWLHMLEVDDDPDCAISKAVEENSLPSWVYGIFLVIWAPVLLSVWMVDALPAPQTYP
jgi:hypothetical protein